MMLIVIRASTTDRASYAFAWGGKLLGVAKVWWMAKYFFYNLFLQSRQIFCPLQALNTPDMVLSVTVINKLS